MTATNESNTSTAADHGATRQHGKKLTIYDIKYLYNTDNYFDTKNLKSVGLTLKSFSVYKIDDRYYMIYIKKHNRIKYYDALENILIGEYTYNQLTGNS